MRIRVKIFINDAQMVCASGKQVKVRYDGIYRISDAQNGPLSVKLRIAAPFRIVRLDDHDSVVDKAFTCQTSEHQVHIQF